MYCLGIFQVHPPWYPSIPNVPQYYYLFFINIFSLYHVSKTFITCLDTCQTLQFLRTVLHSLNEYSGQHIHLTAHHLTKQALSECTTYLLISDSLVAAFPWTHLSTLFLIFVVEFRRNLVE
jgi:hypothetical protein